MNNKMLAIVLILVLAISTVIATVVYFQNSRSESSSSPSSATASSGVIDGLRLSIALEGNKTRYPRGEMVNITLTVMNVSNKTQMFINLNGNATLNFVVYNMSGVSVYTLLWGPWVPINGSVGLVPNENFTNTFNWTQKTLFKEGFPQVPPGDYYIIGETGGNSPHEFETARLNITIEPQVNKFFPFFK